MKTSFEQADEIKDARDKEFLEQFEKDLIAQKLCDLERRIEEEYREDLDNL